MIDDHSRLKQFSDHTRRGCYRDNRGDYRCDSVTE